MWFPQNSKQAPNTIVQSTLGYVCSESTQRNAFISKMGIAWNTNITNHFLTALSLKNTIHPHCLVRIFNTINFKVVAVFKKIVTEIHTESWFTLLHM
jgi:hypothetical protein